MIVSRHFIAATILQICCCLNSYAEDIAIGQDCSEDLTINASSFPPNENFVSFYQHSLSAYISEQETVNTVSLTSSGLYIAPIEILPMYLESVLQANGEKTGEATLYITDFSNSGGSDSWYAFQKIWIFAPLITDVPHNIIACGGVARDMGLIDAASDITSERHHVGFDPRVQFSLMPTNSNFTLPGFVTLTVGYEHLHLNTSMTQGNYIATSSATRAQNVYLSWNIGNQTPFDNAEITNSIDEFIESVFPVEGISVPYGLNSTARYRHIYKDPPYGNMGYRFVDTTWSVPDFSGDYTTLTNQGSVTVNIPETAPIGIYYVSTACACAARNLCVVKMNSLVVNKSIESFEDDAKDIYIEYTVNTNDDSTTSIHLEAKQSPYTFWPDGYPNWTLTRPNGTIDDLTDLDGNNKFDLPIHAPGKYIIKASCGTTVTSTVYALDMNMIPDWNHDRKITSDEKHIGNSTHPFRFWENDDDDVGDISAGDSDVHGQGSLTDDADCDDSSVNGRCDLIDFFPVWLDINQTLLLFPPNDEVKYVLRHDSSGLRGVYTDLTTNTAGAFLTTEGDSYGPDFDQDAYEADSFKIKDSGVTLSVAFLQKIINTPSKGILMIEGAAESALPLVLELWKDEIKVYEKELPLSISHVEKMYRFMNLRTDEGDGTADPGTAVNLPDTVTENHAAVFVHGYNVSAASGTTTHSQVFKRLFQSGFNGRFVGINWFGDADQFSNIGPAEYYESMALAFAISKSVATAIYKIKEEVSPTVDVIAHSAGNMVVSSAIQDHESTFRKYILVDAAVALESYGSSAQIVTNANGSCSLTGIATGMTSSASFDEGLFSVVGHKWDTYDVRLHASEWYRLFPDYDQRYKLTWRNRFDQIGSGNPVAYNFYSSTEEVLRNYEENSLIHGPFWKWLKLVYNEVSTTVPPNVQLEAGDHFPGLYAWVKQEKTKGRKDTWLAPFLGGLPGKWGGWGFAEEGRFIDEILWTVDIGPKSPDEMLEYLTGPDSESFLSSLRFDPFFRPEPEILFDEDELPQFLLAMDSTTIEDLSDTALGCSFEDWLLSHAFPARTWCMGANPHPDLGQNGNIDMSSAAYMSDVSLWPRYCLTPGGNSNRPEWHHSDFLDIAYIHVYKLYDKWNQLMETP